MCTRRGKERNQFQRKTHPLLPVQLNTAAVLSFSSKEEFSTEKVNAAWTRTEPRTLKSSSGTGSPSTGSGVMPLPLPPPHRSESLSSRTSTMSSLQRSDVLNELRSMRHVMNSARDAASIDNNNRYATWESFNENDANDTISQMNSQVSAGTSSHPNYDSNRSASQRTVSSDTPSEFSATSQKSFHSPRLQHPAILPSAVLVPSPPSSPRTTSSRSNRLRRGRGIDQPNQVALPPISGTSSSTQSQASALFATRQPLQQMFPGAASSFPTRSEPDLFSDKSDKFEVNFDAVFSNSSLGPTPIPSNTVAKPAASSISRQADPNDRYACFQEIQNLETFPSIFDNHSSGSDSDTFVGSPPKSIVSSAPAVPAAQNRVPVNPSNPDTDLFGSSNWSAPPQACAISFPPPLVPVPVNPNSALRQADEYKEASATGGSHRPAGDGALAVKQNVNTGTTSNNAILKDVATSPGTPPHVQSVTSHEQFSQHGVNSRSNSSHDPFSALNFKDLQPISYNQNVDSSLFFQVCLILIRNSGTNLLSFSFFGQELKHPAKHSLQELESEMGTKVSCGSQASGTVMTNRVGTERRVSEANDTAPDATRFSSSREPAACPRDRPPSSASSVASSTRNPFAPTDDFDDARSTHSENENVYSSCTSASAFHPQPPTAGHMSRVCSKHPAAAAPFHPMMNHRFDAFAFPHPATPFFPNMSPAFESQFQRTTPSSQMMCHHMTSHASQMHQLQSDCDCRYFYRHPDHRVADMFQHPDLRYQYFQRMQQMYQQHQQKSAPTEFGSSFEFEPDFESSARGMDMRQMSQFAYPSHAHHEHDPFAPAPDSRCLSPNNPFNPMFGPNERMMSAVLESQYGVVPPPRPPARLPDLRRSSFESDASPPPLPKRKTQSNQSPHPNYHNAPREFETRNVYACPPGDHNQSHVSAESPPPPLPLPSRKKSAFSRPQVERRVSFDTPPKPVDDPNDPFNVSYIDKHLNQVSISKLNSSHVTSSLDRSHKIQTSTPLVSECGTIHERPDGLHLSSISKSVSETDQPSLTGVGLNDSSVFESSSLTSAFDSGGYKRLQDDRTRAGSQNTETPESQAKEELEAKDSAKKGPFRHFGEDHISPEERNIFRSKDPFENDDFFAP